MISNELNGLTLANVQCCIHEKNIIWYFTQEQSIYSLYIVFTSTSLKLCFYELIYLSFLQSQVYVNDQFISIKYSLYSFE